MDNADLERLSVSPAKLSPVFHKDTLEYDIVVGSEVSQLKLSLLTVDEDASYGIKASSGGDGGKTVDLKEGEVTSIKIEVTAADGRSTKLYVINAKRVSASDATLSDLGVQSRDLTPAFSPDITDYTVCIPACVTELKIDAAVADTKAKVVLENGDISIPQQLNSGETRFVLKVSSPDGSTEQQYKMCAIRDHVGRSCVVVDRKAAAGLECPICLNLVYRPRGVANSKHSCVFCASCIAVLTRTNKIDPIDESVLEGEWLVEKPDVEINVSQLDVHSWSGEKVQLKQLAKIEKKWKDKNGEPKLSPASADGCSPDGPDVTHSVSARQWEVKLRLEGDDFSPSQADEWLKKYQQSLPKLGSAIQFKTGQSPIDNLYNAAACCAQAIKQCPRDAASHLKLAFVLEEICYAQDLHGVKKSVQDDGDDTGPAAVESSKLEEFLAICQLRGVADSAPLAKQLKAVEEEFMQLKEQGQTAKAEHVQSLYQWKSKQAHRGSKFGSTSSDEETLLGKAYLKYMDALKLDSGGHKYNLHAGRMLLMQGNIEEALVRLKVAMAIKPNVAETRLYYGLALCQQSSRCKEGGRWLNDALSFYLKFRSSSSCTQNDQNNGPVLLADKHLRDTNTQLLRGFIELAQLQKNGNGSDGMLSVEEACRNASLITVQQLGRTINRGEIYRQLEWVLLDAHLLMLDQHKGDISAPEMAERCQRLSVLTRRLTIPAEKELLLVQRQVCEKAVSILPAGSLALCHLGDVQLAQYDVGGESSDVCLNDAMLSYRASIVVEGKLKQSKEIPSTLGEQQWWKDQRAKEQAEIEKAKATATKGQLGSTAASTGRGHGVQQGRTRTNPAGQGTTPGKATSGAGVRPAMTTTGRGRAAPVTGRGASAVKPSTSQTRTAAAAKPSTTVKSTTQPTRQAAGKPASSTNKKPTTTTSARSRVTEAKQPVKPASSDASRRGTTGKSVATLGELKSGVKTSSSTTSTGEGMKTSGNAADKATPQIKQSEDLTPAGEINTKSYHPRLGLARALAHKEDEASQSESQQLYEEVQALAPHVHDAYIELAEMLTKKDVMAAVAVYSKFPFSESPTFDDAYIYREIVHLLIKQEKYDDERLGPNLIGLGRVMGINSMEKYVNILDAKFKTKLLKSVYAGVHGKDIDDPDLQAFFKFKCWS